MKHLFTLIISLISFSLHSQWNGTASTGMFITGNTASGAYSTAMGWSTQAIGDYSTTTGWSTQASDLWATAMGYETQASGGISTAMGGSTQAIGDYSTTTGRSTIAKGYGTLAIGVYNTLDTSADRYHFSLTNRAFVIGNGESMSRSDAMTVLFDGTTTIAGSVTAASFIGDGSSLTNMPLLFNASNGTGIESPSNTANGAYSTAMGTNTEASGIYSTAIGGSTQASGIYSTAMGGSTQASGEASIAMGLFTGATGSFSTAMGSSTQASGEASTSMGLFTEAYGDYSTAMGRRTQAKGYGTLAVGFYNTLDTSADPNNFGLTNRAFVIGNGTSTSRSDAMTVLFDGTTTITGSVTASSFIGDGSSLTNMPLLFNASNGTGIESPSNTAGGEYSTATGAWNEANGDYSSASGFTTKAEDFATFTIGQFNTTDTSPNPTTYDPSNRAFVIGNGKDKFNLSDAMLVLFDGTTTIAGDLTLNSDARLKTNISSLGNTLPLLKMLDGKKYTLKADADKEKMGLLAQDVREVFPQLVREGSDDLGTLSLNYQGLIPVLINAVNEQQEMIESFEVKLIKQQEQIDRLTEMVEKLVSKDYKA